MRRLRQRPRQLATGEPSTDTGGQQRHTSEPATQASTSEAANVRSEAEQLSFLLTEENIAREFCEALGLDTDNAELQQLLISAAETAKDQLRESLEDNRGASPSLMPTRDIVAALDASDNVSSESPTRWRSDHEQAGDASMYDAVVGGDVEIVRVLLGLGADPNSTGARENFRVPLHEAAVTGNLEMLELLLDSGALIEIGDHSDWTALMFASQCGHSEVVRFLLDRGAKIDALSDTLLTALMISSRTNAETVQCLIDHRAGVNDTDANGWTALHYCAASGHPISARTLLNNGACVDPKDSDGRTPLILAAVQGKLEVMKVLLKNGASVSRSGQDRRTAMMTAIGATNREAVSLLCRYGADINARVEPSKVTSLIMAVDSEEIEVVEFCLSIGCDVHAEDKNGWTALHFAARKGNVEIGRLLLRGGATLEAGSEGTPLHIALMHGRVAFVRWLLGAGADVHARGGMGLTGMHYAAFEHDQGEEVYEQLMWMLLKNRVKVNHTDNMGNTSLHIAAISENVPAIRALLSLGANVACKNEDGRSPLDCACNESSLEAVKLLVEMGQGKISEQSNNGSHPLYLAAEKGHEDIMHYLLLKGASVNLPDAKGVSPLMAAVLCNRAGSVRMLLRAGADPNLKGKEGAAAIHVAAQNGHTEIVQLLLDAGADPFLETDKSRTALHIAVTKGHRDIVTLLRDIMKEDGQTSAGEESHIGSPSQVSCECRIETPPSEDDSCQLAILCCPITKDIMKDPVVAADGHTYERKAISEWIQSRRISPLTKQPLSLQALIPNLSIRDQIELYRGTHSN